MPHSLHSRAGEIGVTPVHETQIELHSHSHLTIGGSQLGGSSAGGLDSL